MNRKKSWEWAYPLQRLAAKLNHLNFHPLEGVSRYRHPQLQLGKNYSYLFNLRPKMCKF